MTADAPVVPTRAAIEAAAARIGPYVRRTPVLALGDGELAPGVGPVAAKLDLLQPTGSFKVRGAFAWMTAAAPPPAGVAAASGGNFGLAFAHAARRLGVAATVFVPATSPAAKVERLHRLGARVEVVDGYYDEAQAACDAHARRTGALRGHPFDLPDVVAGQGTCAREFETQAELDTVLVAVGGAGLLGGVAAWYGDTVRIIGVETDGCPALHAARRAGRPVEVEVGGLAADSLGARRVGEIGFALARRAVDDVVLVTDGAVRGAQRRWWEAARLVVEPGGAAATAALTSGAYVPADGERVGVIVCGANCDPADVTGHSSPSS